MESYIRDVSGEIFLLNACLCVNTRTTHVFFFYSKSLHQEFSTVQYFSRFEFLIQIAKITNSVHVQGWKSYTF